VASQERFHASGWLNRAGYATALFGAFVGFVAWMVAVGAMEGNGPAAVAIGVVVFIPFAVLGFTMVRRVRRLGLALVVDDAGVSLERGGHLRTIQWDQLEAIGLEQRIRIRPKLWGDGSPQSHLVGWPATGQGPLRLTASAERSHRTPPGGYRLVDLKWFAESERLTGAVKQHAGRRWRDDAARTL
jgi:hypothetical protein